MAKQKIDIVEEKKAPFKTGNGIETVMQAMISVLKKCAHYTVGDQDQPCVILWTDPESLWKGVIPELKMILPQLFVFGTYNPGERSGPAVWLRCIEARTVESCLDVNTVPIFYLPGISRQKLRDVEDCPSELQPLVELLFRGTIWIHPNGKDWTPYAFLTSQLGGLGLEIDKDSATAEALLRALPQVLKEKLVDLQHKKLDAAFFNGLLAPDLPASLLKWMDAPDQFRSEKNTSEWKAFCQQCVAEYHFNPEKDGELKAAELLGRRQGNWKIVWGRYIDAPRRYLGVVTLLERINTPGDITLLDQDSWPVLNSQRESELSEALIQLKNKRPDETRKIIRDLEKSHGNRRDWVWAALGRSQLALALEHLSRLAELTEKPLAAASTSEIAEFYIQNGWETDAEALEALICCTRLEQEQPICIAVRSLYADWLDISASNLQNLVKSNPKNIMQQLEPVEAKNGRVIVFTDGLRYDIAQMVLGKLRSNNLQPELQWDWTPYPSVTATAKPYISPITHLFKGGEAGDNFEVTVTQSGQHLTSERFQQLLSQNDIQVLKEMETGKPEGRAWTEIGGVDGHGHDEGWKLSKNLRQDIQDISDRVCQLLSAGWKEVVIVTDHGWLLLPEGFPNVKLPKFLTESDDRPVGHSRDGLHRFSLSSATITISATPARSMPRRSWPTTSWPIGRNCRPIGMLAPASPPTFR